MSRIGILDFGGVQRVSAKSKKLVNPAKYFIRDIKAKGHSGVFYDVFKCEMEFLNNEISMSYAGKKISSVNVLYPLFFYEKNLDLESSIVKQFQLMGAKIVNGYLPMVFAKNRMRVFQRLGLRNVPVVKSVVVKDFSKIDRAVMEVGGYPVIVKLPHSADGKGILLLESRRGLISTLDILLQNGAGKTLIVQQYVDFNKGSDFQVMVVGGKIIGAIKRSVGVEDDFRSSFDFGGVGHKVELSDGMKQLVLDAVNALHLDVCLVGVMDTLDGPVVVDVDIFPNYLYLGEIMGVDIVSSIVDYLINLSY